MWWRALLAFLALPGLVAIAVPAFLAAGELRRGATPHLAGFLLL